MPDDNRVFAICFWSNLSAEDLAAPGDAARLSAHNMGQRVCRVVGEGARFLHIKYGDHSFEISATCLRYVKNV